MEAAASSGVMSALGIAHDPVAEGEATRVRMAARPTTPPNLLHALADDPAVTVRAAVALNPAFAPDADGRLAADSDDRVRMLLAGKLARLLPGLSGQDQAAALTHVRQTLLTLAGDAAVQVRGAIADALRSMPDAPRALILKLAHDPVAAVSEPVIRFSPLLTDDDLLELLALPPHPGAAAMIAHRPGLSGRVADEIAAHADSAAVRALLTNPSALIQESTLDTLIGRAGDHPEWHEPLARRPSLSPRAVLALSQMVASQILEMLANRPDLAPGIADALREQLSRSLAEPTPLTGPDTAQADTLTGPVTDQMLLDIALAGDHRQMAAILAAASGVPPAAFDRAVAHRSAKALVSLVWRAGFSMRTATTVQVLLGRLSPDEMLSPDPTGAYPLSPREMEWQIELLAEPGR